MNSYHSTIPEVLYPMQKDSLRLITVLPPARFRYAIYFHQGERSRSRSIRQEMEQKERKAMELANQTADIIFPGEQQPESDHASGTNRRKPEPTETVIFDATKGCSATL